MNSIPISQIVEVPPRVVSAGGVQSSLDGMLLTQSTAVAPGQLQTFYSSADVGAFFGNTSDEYAAAAVYFSGVLGGGQLPSSLNFARYANVAGGAAVYGAPLTLTLSQLQALTGTLIVTTDTQRTSSAINLSTATSFADAAAKLTAGFTTPNFVITYDTQRNRFVLTTTATGASAVVSAVTGTLANGVGLSSASGAYLQAAGVDADTPASGMNRVRSLSGNWGIFSTVWAASLADRLAFAAWNSSEGSFEYLYAPWGLDAADIVATNAASFGAQVFAAGYQGTIPVYGGLGVAAGVLAWGAATNFLLTEGRNTLAFRQIAAAPAISADTLAKAQALLSNNYTYYGLYASAGNSYTIMYDGKVSGQFNWADTYLGQIWLRRTLRQSLFETLLANNSLPYNADGFAQIYQGAQATIRQALANGVIRTGVALSPSQAAVINTQAGRIIDNEVSTVGWYLLVSPPLNASTRTGRGSPVVNLWYCDGGSIQKLTVVSTTVL